MSNNELTIFKDGGAAPSTVFKGADLPKTKLGDGIEGGMPWCRIAYKAKDWSIRDGAKVMPVKTRDLNLVILKAANHPSRRWFKDGYKDGDNRAPDCYSTMGFRPDAGSTDKQDGGQGCLLCPWSRFGSKEGSKGKACHEYKNLAVVPAGDIENKGLRGPMLFAIPPNSLKALKQYEAILDSNNVHYAQVVTNVSFAPGQLFEFAFDAETFLDDVQAAQAIKMMKNPMVDRILDEEIAISAGDTDGPAAGVGEVHKLKDISEPAKPEPAPAKTPEDKPVQAQTPQEKPAPAAPEMTPAEQEIADLKAKLAAAEAKAVAPKRGRPRQNGARTPQVAPTNMDSAELKGPPLPEPVGEPQVKTPANDGLQAAGKDPALDAINATLSRAKGLV
jgi:hypothetical protein